MGGAKDTASGHPEMIKTIEDYNELAELADTGADRLASGTGESGVHYYIMHILNTKYGIFVLTREEAVSTAKRLCNEYIDSLHYEEMAEKA